MPPKPNDVETAASTRSVTAADVVPQDRIVCSPEPSPRTRYRVPPVRPWGRHVIGVVAGAEAEDLRDDPRAASHCGLSLLEDEHGRSLAHDEAVPLPIERAGGARRVVVALGEDADHRERPERERRQGSFGPAGQRRLHRSVTNGSERLTDRHGPGCARVGVADTRSGQVEVERHVARSGAAEDRKRERRRDPAHPSRDESGVLLLAERDPAER